MRAGRAAAHPRGALDPPRHRRDDGTCTTSEYEAFVAAGAADDPDADASADAPLLLIYTAAFDGPAERRDAAVAVR